MGSDSETEKSVKDKKKMMALAPISKPLAGKKLCKRTLKLVRRGKIRPMVSIWMCCGFKSLVYRGVGGRGRGVGFVPVRTIVGGGP